MLPTDFADATLMWRVVLALARCGVALALVPVFATQRLTAVGLAALALALSVPVAANTAWYPALAVDLAPLLGLFLHEAAIGSLIGLGFGAFCAGVGAAGDLIDRQTGLTFSQSVDPFSGNGVSVTSIVLENVVFAALVGGGLVLSIADTLYASYALWPIDQAFPTIGRVVPLLAAQGASAFLSLALLLAGPVVLVLFVVDLSLGLLNRAAPTLNVFSLSMSMKSLVGLGVLVFALPLVIQRCLEAARTTAALLRQLMAIGG